ncbi:hypothetical protein P9112_005190 [Eukaryota sp. TZLM1-RC]
MDPNKSSSSKERARKAWASLAEDAEREKIHYARPPEIESEHSLDIQDPYANRDILESREVKTESKPSLLAKSTSRKQSSNKGSAAKDKQSQGHAT